MIKDNKEPIIGLAAHCSGAVAGILLGFIAYINGKTKTNAQSLNVFYYVIIFFCLIRCSDRKIVKII